MSRKIFIFALVGSLISSPLVAGNGGIAERFGNLWRACLQTVWWCGAPLESFPAEKKLTPSANNIVFPFLDVARNLPPGLDANFHMAGPQLHALLISRVPEDTDGITHLSQILERLVRELNPLSPSQAAVLLAHPASEVRFKARALLQATFVEIAFRIFFHTHVIDMARKSSATAVADSASKFLPLLRSARLTNYGDLRKLLSEAPVRGLSARQRERVISYTEQGWARRTRQHSVLRLTTLNWELPFWVAQRARARLWGAARFDVTIPEAATTAEETFQIHEVYFSAAEGITDAYIHVAVEPMQAEDAQAPAWTRYIAQSLVNCSRVNR